jgi:hypothetical protein
MKAIRQNQGALEFACILGVTALPALCFLAGSLAIPPAAKEVSAVIVQTVALWLFASIFWEALPYMWRLFGKFRGVRLGFTVGGFGIPLVLLFLHDLVVRLLVHRLYTGSEELKTSLLDPPMRYRTMPSQSRFTGHDMISDVSTKHSN